MKFLFRIYEIQFFPKPIRYADILNEFDGNGRKGMHNMERLIAT